MAIERKRETDRYRETKRNRGKVMDNDGGRETSTQSQTERERHREGNR